jgi:hypothetical protein
MLWMRRSFDRCRWCSQEARACRAVDSARRVGTTSLPWDLMPVLVCITRAAFYNALTCESLQSISAIRIVVCVPRRSSMIARTPLRYRYTGGPVIILCVRCSDKSGGYHSRHRCPTLLPPLACLAIGPHTDRRRRRRRRR